ncbi:MAG: hypothetical protein ACQERF_11390, partial [Actinomycetota bacterium]
MTAAGDLPDHPRPAPGTTRPAPGTTRHWMVLAGAAMLMIGFMFVVLSFSLVNPPLARELGVGLSQVMIYNSILGLTGAVAMTTIGPWAARVLGPRRTIIIGGALTALSLFAISFT